MKHISAIFLATAFLLPTTLTSHSAEKAINKNKYSLYQQAGGVAAEKLKQTASAARRVARWRKPGSLRSSSEDELRSRRGAAAPRQQQNWVCDLPARMDASWFCTRTQPRARIGKAPNREALPKGQMSVCKTNMPSFADVNSRATRYSYDRLGRVTTKQLPLSEGTVTYTYDINTGSENAKGRLAKLEDPAQTKTFSYDKLGRTKKEIRNHKTVTHTQLNVNYETEYEYDLLGRLKSVKYPENPVSDTRAKACYEYGNTSFVKRVQINVDAESLLFTENCNRDIVSNITYNEFGQTKMFRLGNGVETRYTYDIKGRLIRLKSQREEDGSIKIYQDADYAFAIDNNIRSIHNNNSYYQANYAYTYDGLDRLVDSNGSFQEHPNPVNSNDTTEQRFRRAFQYAKNGNLTRKEIFDTQTQEVTEGWDYSYANHAATQIAVNGSSRFRMSYDSVGNLTEKEDLTNNLHKELSYDSYNRISQIRDAANDVVVGAYHYDDQGFRVHKKGYYEKGSTPKNVEIIYPSMFYGIEYVPEDSTADSINNIYLNGIRIAALDQNSAVAYFITDQVDSVNLILDDAGDVLTTTQHLPYGETFVHRGDTDFVPKFNSQELDKESGLYYFNARYYDGEIARFSSADLVIPDDIDTQSWNRFAYSFNNPILYKDPTGHLPAIIIAAVPLALAALDFLTDTTPLNDYKNDENEQAKAQEALKDKIQEKAIDKAASLIEKTVRRCAGPSKKGILCSLIGGGASIFESKNGQVKEKIRNKGPMPARDHVVPHPDTSHAQKHTNGKHGIQGKKPPKASDDTKGLEKQLKIHEKKFKEFTKNPEKFDNKGHLRNAGSNQERRKKIIEGRKNSLLRQISNFKKQIEEKKSN